MALNLTVHFNCSTKVAYVKDDSTYSSPSSVRKYVFGRLNYPNGTAVFSKNDVNDTNNSLISFNANPRVSANYTLGAMPAGNYTFSGTVLYEYSNQNADPANQYAYFNASNQFSILNADLTEALLVGGTITIANASATENNGTYNVTAVEYIAGATKVTIAENTLLENIIPDGQAEITFETSILVSNNVVYNYSTCAATLCPEINFTYDAFSTQYGSATLADNTNYYGWTIENRALSLYYPAGLTPAPEDPFIVTDLSNITINVLATGIYTCKLVVTASYVQNDGLVLDLTVTKIKQATVIAYTEMCGIQNCITKMLDRHTSYLKSAKISPLQQYVDQVYGLYINAKEALACGDKGSYSNYVSQIYTILGTTEDCDTCSCGGSCDSCSDSCGCGQPDEPVWIDNLGIDVNSLLAEFNTFITEEWPAYQGTVDSLNTTVTEEVLPAISTLQTQVGAIGTQTNTNTGDISGLQTQVDTLDSEVTALQEQIATFSPSNSEVALNELFTNDGNKKILYTASTGAPAIGFTTTRYAVNITGDITSVLANNESVTFYSVADSAWYEGTIYSFSYNGPGNYTQVVVQTISPTAWSVNISSFPFFIAKPDVGTYTFTKSFTLQNDNYWKLEDSQYKYWAKLKTSLLWNGVSFEFLTINNGTEDLKVRGINPGTMVDLELTFEKLWNGSAYDLVYMLDLRSSSSVNYQAVSGQLRSAGYTGYNPTENSDLYQNTTREEIVSPNMGAGLNGIYNITQDVYNTQGNLNSNRIISRYASGPSYPNNTSTQFFTGGNDVITFNSLNCNMTILNFEVSYGKMPA